MRKALGDVQRGMPRKGMRLTTCAEFQPNERYSSVRSVLGQAERFNEDSPLSQ